MNPSKAQETPQTTLPYAGLRVIEFTHMVMGPTCGMVIADLGAEVIKVEPIGHGHHGDSTRHLLGSGAVFLPCLTATKKAWRWICKLLRAKRPCCA